MLIDIYAITHFCGMQAQVLQVLLAAKQDFHACLESDRQKQEILMRRLSCLPAVGRTEAGEGLLSSRHLGAAVQRPLRSQLPV